jgi:hypothetical protein
MPLPIEDYALIRGRGFARETGDRIPEPYGAGRQIQ